MLRTLLQNQQEALDLSDKYQNEEVKNKYSMSVLMYAIMQQNTQLAMTRQCEILVQDVFGNNAVHYCIHYNNIVILEWILEQNPQVLLQQNYKNQTPIDLVYKRILQQQNQQNSNISTYQKQFELMISFYRQFYTENNQNPLQNHNTPLHYALQCNLINNQIPEIYNCWFTSQNDDNITPLMIACKYCQNITAIQQLFQTRDIIDKNNLDYLDYLVQNKKYEFVQTTMEGLGQQTQFQNRQKVISLLINSFNSKNTDIIMYIAGKFNIKKKDLTDQQIEQAIDFSIQQGDLEFLKSSCQILSLKFNKIIQENISEIFKTQNDIFITKIIQQQEDYFNGLIYAIQYDNNFVFIFCYKKKKGLEKQLEKQYNMNLLQLIISKNAQKILAQIILQARNGDNQIEQILYQTIGKNYYDGLQYSLIVKNVTCAKLLVCCLPVKQYLINPLIIALDQQIQDEDLYKMLIKYKTIPLGYQYQNYPTGTTYKDVIMKKATPMNIINILQ